MYEKLRYAVVDAVQYLEMGGRVSDMFYVTVDDLISAIDAQDSPEQIEELLRYNRLNVFMNLRGEEKNVMDNLLYELLDIIKFG